MVEQGAGEAPTDPPEKHGELRVAAAQGAKWNFLQIIVTQGGRLAFTFVLARLLGPESFGIMAQATIYVGFTLLVLDQGFAVALVQKKVLDDRDIGAVRVLNLAAGAVMAGATLVAAPAIADFFHTPELTAVLRVLAVSVLLKSFQIVPQALVRRELLYRAQSIVQIVAMVTGGVVGVASALLGADYWALVVQTIVTDVAILIGLRMIKPTPRTPLAGTFGNLRAMWGFSVGILGSRFLSYFGSNVDNLLIGRFESATSLAFYALSYRFLRLPLEMIGSVVNNVALPVFAKLQDDQARLRAWYLQATGFVALVSYPILALLVVGAPDGIPLAFGEEWQPASTPLQILSLGGMLFVVRMQMAPMAQAKGRSDLVFWWSLITFGLQGAAFLVGVQYGIVGVALAYLIVQAVTTPPNVVHFGRLIDMRLSEFLAAVAPAFTGALVMAAAWEAVSLSLEQLSDVPTLGRLAAATAVALPVYVGTIRALWPARFGAARNMFVTMAGRG